jgi:hypothetical protein
MRDALLIYKGAILLKILEVKIKIKEAITGVENYQKFIF